jgi:tetratricopeptide (TPR) repeat protein
LLNLHKPIGEALSDMSAVTRVQATVSRLDYLTTQAAVVATYLRLLVFPVDQNLDHDFPIYRSFLAPRVAGSVALLLGLAALATYLYWRTAPGARRPLDPGARLISFGIAWFFVTLAVESSVIPIVDIIYEHRVYLPSVGLFAATATACALLLRGISRENPARATVLAGILVALLLAALTLERNAVWADGVSLWTDAAEKSPGKSRPHCNLGTALAAAARPGEAASELRRAVDIDPGSSYARAQLGAVLLTLGRPAEAEPELREAIRLQPKDPEAIFNLAMMLWNTRRSPESKVWFKRFLEVSPSSYVDARRIAAARANR